MFFYFIMWYYHRKVDKTIKDRWIKEEKELQSLLWLIVKKVIIVI